MKILLILILIVSVNKNCFNQEASKLSEEKERTEQKQLKEFREKHKQFILDNPDNVQCFDNKIRKIIKNEEQLLEDYKIIPDDTKELQAEEEMKEFLPDVQSQVVQDELMKEFQILEQQRVQEKIYRDDSEKDQQVTNQLEKAIHRDNTELGLKTETEQKSNKKNFGRKRLVKGPTQFDSRVEIRFFNPDIPWHSKIIANSISVGVIVEKSRLHLITDSIYQLDLGVTLGEKYNLCKNEAYESQPCVGVGTAFVIDEQEMLTAGHVFTGNLNEYAIIFGYEKIFLNSEYESLLAKKNVYFPIEVLKHNYTLDIIQFKADRKINRFPLKYSSGKLIDNSMVYMIGFPMGLPQKVAMNARVMDNMHPQYFFTSLDAFQGNSGSPVFNLLTNEVIGILVSGEVDYSWTGTCNTSKECSYPYCKGEKVIRIEQFMIQ